MRIRKLKHNESLDSKDYIIYLVWADGTLKFIGQGLRFRQNPLHPIGWQKLSTAEKYADEIRRAMYPEWFAKIQEVGVCERVGTFSCLSSYAISKQNTSEEVTK